MCASDALGIGADVRGAIEIASRDPLTGEEIQVEVEPPTGARQLAAARGGSRPLRRERKRRVLLQLLSGAERPRIHRERGAVARCAPGG